MQSFLNFLTIIAFVMSSITWLLTAYNRSIRISLDIIDYTKYNNGIFQFFIHIQNNSEKPLTISGVSLVVDGRKYPCELVSKRIRTFKGVVTQATPNFPLNFSSSQGRMEFLEFLRCPDIELAPGKTVDFEIYTNRKAINRSLKLPQPGRFYSLRQ